MTGVLIIGFIYYIIGWFHAVIHVGFPTDRGLFTSVFLWPIYYIGCNQ